MRLLSRQDHLAHTENQKNSGECFHGEILAERMSYRPSDNCGLKRGADSLSCNPGRRSHPNPTSIILMNRRNLLASFAATSLTQPLAALGSRDEKSAKKGWCGGNVELHKLFDVNWHYTWSPGWKRNKDVEFVPMIKKEADFKHANGIPGNKDFKALLGFNEPERAKQGNLTVDQAVKLWPRIEKLAEKNELPIGSPAPSSDQGGLAWLDRFMERADKEELKVDFIAVHYYRSHNPDDLEKFIEGLAKKYDRPIWLTEFNGWSGPEDEHYKFLKKALKFLEKSRDVERYAYFNVNSSKPHALVDTHGEPTRMGKLYQEAGT